MTVISHNISAMNAQRQFGINTNNKAKAAEKLSSGYRINRAADDAAGLSISEKMRRQIRGLEQGVENTEAGVSLCQVADGALAEVHDMLHRMTELSVQSANGTNSLTDRQYIQKEINEILVEIDRISETTKFNNIPIFKGEGKTTSRVEGNFLEVGDIPFSDFALADVDLGNTPFNENSHPDHLNLQAIVNNKTSIAYGRQYDLIYGDGSTSSSSFRITSLSTQNNFTATVRMDQLQVEEGSYSYDEQTQTWKRTFNYKNDTMGFDVDITQNIHLEEVSGGKEKNYVITYDFANKTATAVNFEFMFHADTAYNNNDLCEGYFIEGERIGKFSVYSEEDSKLIEGSTSPYIEKDIPDSFSIVDVDKALAFSEKVSFEGGNKPNSLSIGHYYYIDDWSYYNANLDYNLGLDAERRDLGFSLYYNLNINDTNSTDNTQSLTFRYGIIAAETDKNLQSVLYVNDTTVLERSQGDKQIWIQSGADTSDGIPLFFGRMDTEHLGIDKINVCSIEGAEKAIRAMDRALIRLNENRSQIGAQQNRLEHTIANENNIIENTTAAESRIRDVDMAEEMVKFSVESILSQAGQAMMAQANQSNNGIMNLLQ